MNRSLLYFRIYFIFGFGCFSSCSPIETKIDTRHSLAYHYKAKKRKLERKTVVQDIIHNSSDITKIVFTQQSEKDTFTMTFELPKGIDKIHFKINNTDTTAISLIDTKTIYYDGESYTINKYFQNEYSAIDEELLIYYCDQIGILRIESYTWQNYTELISDEAGRQDVIFTIKDQVIHRTKGVLSESNYFNSH